MGKQSVWVGTPAAGAPYTPGIRAGGFVFVSGQLALDPQTGKMIEGEFEDRVRQCIANVGRVLEASGSGLERAVKVTVFLTDLGNFARMNAVYSEHWGAVKPARSCVQVARLPLDADVEIEAIALDAG